MLERKADAGAKFVITQPVFEARNRAPLPRARKPHRAQAVIFGILPVKRESMANYMKTRIADLARSAASTWTVTPG